MNKILFTTFAIASVMVISGCVSLDERLASNDPRVKNEAEHELIASSRENGDEAMRVAAVKRITNKDYLYEIAMSAEPSYRTNGGKKISTVAEGVAAVEQLGLDVAKKDDFKKLISFITQSKSTEVRLAALAKISSEVVIAHIAAGNSDAKVRQAAWARVNTESGFAEVAKGAIDKKMAAEAFEKLKDQKYIDEVVLKTSDKTILLSGMGKVSDKTALASHVFSKEFIGDKEVTGRFIADSADDAMLVKIVNEHGEELTSEQFAAIKAKSKSVEVQNAIAAIADKKIASAIKQLLKKEDVTYRLSPSKDKVRQLADLFAKMSNQELIRNTAIELLCVKHAIDMEVYRAVTSVLTTEDVIAVVGKCLKFDERNNGENAALLLSIPKKQIGSVIAVYFDDIAVQSHFVELLDRVKGKEAWMEFVQKLPADLKLRDSEMMDLFDAMSSDHAVADMFFDKYHSYFESKIGNSSLHRLYVRLIERMSTEKKKDIGNAARKIAEMQKDKSILFGPFYLGMPYVDALVLAEEIGGIAVYSYSNAPKVRKLSFSNKAKFQFIDCKDSLVLPQFIHQFIEGKSGKVSSDFDYVSDIRSEFGTDGDDRLYQAYSNTKRGIKVQYCPKDGVLNMVEL